jgi:hypothetical protein
VVLREVQQHIRSRARPLKLCYSRRDTSPGTAGATQALPAPEWLHGQGTHPDRVQAAHSFPEDRIVAEAIVYIWPYKGLDHFGHVGLKLKGVPGLKADKKVYMSWWPDHANSHPHTRIERAARRVRGALNTLAMPMPYSTGAFRDRQAVADELAEMSEKTRKLLDIGALVPRPLQKLKAIGVLEGYDNPPQDTTKPLQVISDDLLLTFQDLDYVPTVNADTGVVSVWVEKAIRVRIPLVGHMGRQCGLDGVRMYRWWKVFRASPTNRYRLLSRKQNCAAVIARALQAGGGELYASMPNPGFFMHPNHVHEWADAIKSRIEQLTTWHCPPTKPLPKNIPQEIMKLQDWKDNTRRGVLSRRGPYILAIDRLMARYWAISGTWASRYEERVEVLGEILDQVHKYLIRRPHGSRADTVIELGEQILSTVQYRAFFEVEDPPKWAS